jgi:hypothetical protein
MPIRAAGAFVFVRTFFQLVADLVELGVLLKTILL